MCTRRLRCRATHTPHITANPAKFKLIPSIQNAECHILSNNVACANSAQIKREPKIDEKMPWEYTYFFFIKMRAMHNPNLWTNAAMSANVQQKENEKLKNAHSFRTARSTREWELREKCTRLALAVVGTLETLHARWIWIRIAHCVAVSTW